MQDVIDFWDGGQPEFRKYLNVESTSSTVILTILSLALLSAYFYLIYNIRKYYKGRMVLEMCRLRTLFAVFCICYGLRAVYTYGEGKYRNFIKNIVLRWHFINTMSVIWDILPILSILVMHHFTYKAKQEADNKSESSHAIR